MPNYTFLEAYKKIISFPTISAMDEPLDLSNKALIDWLGNVFSSMGFRISIQKVPHARNKYNMLAQIGSGQGGLLLAGHSDTVPFDEGRWNFDPFKAQVKDNLLYGLGSCDMKGFFAFILESLKDIPLDKINKPLYILATADEETSMAGARFFAEQQLIKPDMAIIGEPTELKPIGKHKGHMAQSLQITGQAGHSSDPDRGVNAIEIMVQAIEKLLTLRDSLARNYRDDSFSVPQATMNLGHIHGGDGENRICGHCKLNFDVRCVPGLTDDEVITQIDQALAPLKLSYPDRIDMQLMYPTAPAFACKNEHQIIELAEKLTGFKVENANYATEAPFINQLGCDTLVLGPGSIKQAHQPDEFISLDYVDPTVSLLRNMIKHVCYSK
ncbi:acetylornithine deacetylase [Aliiglaciecola sp. LCG003]|uniref:acetylornithine deacetylase n=1 Tax=Aliiglaciecola sp. LCG003 TaxID=3053655 RepID=UPI00257477EC|nr:acetylornithine deacetylase [Aliiglaciecola sp. LCG003]WJG10025.1 acetylornithine deacetylase [Aliiglaciecola sp. LCG003]